MKKVEIARRIRFQGVRYLLDKRFKTWWLFEIRKARRNIILRKRINRSQHCERKKWLELLQKASIGWWIVLRSSIRCATPDVHSLPAITPGESSLIAVLSVIPASSSSLPPLASTNFTFFDCTRFATCSECAQSQFPCDWCLRFVHLDLGYKTGQHQLFIICLKRKWRPAGSGIYHQ